MNSRIVTGFFFFMFSTALFSFHQKNGLAVENRTTNRQPATGDTSFRANAEAGWTALSCYLHADSTDSVDFEVILNHTGEMVDWNAGQLTGAITGTAFLPDREISVEYQLLPENVWNVRITTEGKMYIKIVTGAGPSENPAIIPFKIRFSPKE